MLGTLKDVVDSASSVVDFWRSRKEADQKATAMLRLLYVEVLRNLEVLRLFVAPAGEAASATPVHDPAWANVAGLLRISAHEAVFATLQPGALRSSPRGAGVFPSVLLDPSSPPPPAADEGPTDPRDGGSSWQRHFVTPLDSLRFVCVKVGALERVASIDPARHPPRREWHFPVRLRNILAHEAYLEGRLREHLDEDLRRTAS